MVERDVDFIFVEMVGKVAGFDSVLGLVAIDWFEEFDYWEKDEQGCCICMFLVYADKENDIEPVTIEQNIPKKTPDPSQIAGNSIREYHKRQ